MGEDGSSQPIVLSLGPTKYDECVRMPVNLEICKRVRVSHLGSNGNPTWGRMAIPLGVKWQSHLGSIGNPTWGQMAIPLGVEWQSHMGSNGNPNMGQK